DRGGVSSDGGQALDPHLLEHPESVGHVFFLLGRVGPGGAQDTAAAQVAGRDLLDGQLAVVLGGAFDEVPEAVLEADHVHAVVEDGLDGDGRDDAVDARGGAAADEDAESLTVKGTGHDWLARCFRIWLVGNELAVARGWSALGLQVRATARRSGSPGV